MDIPPGVAIAEEDWKNTPASVQAVVVTLQHQVQTLQAQLAAMQAEVAQWRERAGQTSRNSSRPPSSDGPAMPPRPKRVPSGRKVGGQPGHAGHTRPLKPVEDMNRVVDVRPTACSACGALMMGDDPQPVRHQVAELPRLQPEE